ncbi:MAG: hypothetical protein HRU70_04770 [Phycisphaeraceae bacterium]|nr:MAG: hypothetical protein HRU70_04770 [Phycisphaeraceae bacterium]
MSALSRQPDSPLVVRSWQPDVAQLLDESHLAAYSDHSGRRLQFAASLGQFLGAQRDTDVCTLYGRFITDLESICHQLERAIPGPVLSRRVDGTDGVTSLLRYRPSFPGRRATRFRYYLWHDADVLLEHDPPLFGRVVDALAGVAAEDEYVNDDLLLIHRTVLVGGAGLRAYLDEPNGQCRSWFDDGLGEPFWRIVTGIEQPTFTGCGIDALDR